jgi:hypothetical protein
MPLSDQDVTETHPDSLLAPLPSIYIAADYKWEWHGQWLPIRIGEPAPALDVAYPDALRFGMLTASNPGCVKQDDADNRAADLALQQTLESHGLRHRPACAVAQNRAWKLYNWLVIDPDETTFAAIGRQFGQIGALLWTRGEAVRLRIHAKRPQTLPEHPHIDWIDDRIGTRMAPIEAKSAFTT